MNSPNKIQLSKLPRPIQRLKLYFFKLEFTLCKAEQPLRDMKLQEKEAQKE